LSLPTTTSRCRSPWWRLEKARGMYPRSDLELRSSPLHVLHYPTKLTHTLAMYTEPDRRCRGSRCKQTRHCGSCAFVDITTRPKLVVNLRGLNLLRLFARESLLREYQIVHGSPSRSSQLQVADAAFSTWLRVHQLDGGYISVAPAPKAHGISCRQH